MKYLILCGSVTDVLRAKEAFLQNGRLAGVGRAPSVVTQTHGCLYTLTTTTPPDESHRILQKARLNSARIYEMLPDGSPGAEV